MISSSPSTGNLVEFTISPVIIAPNLTEELNFRQR